MHTCSDLTAPCSDRMHGCSDRTAPCSDRMPGCSDRMHRCTDRMRTCSDRTNSRSDRIARRSGSSARRTADSQARTADPRANSDDVSRCSADHDRCTDRPSTSTGHISLAADHCSLGTDHPSSLANRVDHAAGADSSLLAETARSIPNATHCIEAVSLLSFPVSIYRAEHATFIERRNETADAALTSSHHSRPHQATVTDAHGGHFHGPRPSTQRRTVCITDRTRYSMR